MAESQIEAFLEKLNSALAVGFGEGVVTVTSSPSPADAGNEMTVFDSKLSIEQTAMFGIPNDAIVAENFEELATFTATQLAKVFADVVGPLAAGMLMATPEAFIAEPTFDEQLGEMLKEVSDD